MPELKLVSPLRLQTYRDERTNTQTYQWVLSEYDSDALAKWRSVINGADVVVQEVNTVDLVAEMYFYVTTNTTAGGATLFVSDAPTLSLGGTCTYGGDDVCWDVTQELWDTNGLQIFLNGVKQVKGSDVTFSSTNNLVFSKRLQVGDYIVIDHFQGV